jgi:hypothetical protein
MAAFQLGNNFWERRSKHGCDKLFKTPDLMWEAACEYFAWCVENPLLSTEYHGKDAEEKLVPKVRAFTMQGLCLYLGCNTKYFNNFESQIKEDDPLYSDFNYIIARIRETVFTQKFEHAAAGLLNANLIARELGIAEKTDVTNKTITVEIED